MKSVTSKIPSGVSEKERMERLRAAMSELEEVDAREDDLKLVIPSFARCNSAYLTAGNFTGLHWSFQLLQGIIRKSFHNPDAPVEPLVTTHVFTLLCNSFGTEDDVESPQALAAFHVAHFASTVLNLEGTERWYWKSLVHAKTRYLGYLAVTGLGTLLLKQARMEEALGCFKAGMEYVRHVDEDSFAISSYCTSKVLVKLGCIQEAMETLIRAGEGSFVSTLAVSLNADIIRATETSSVEQTVKGYTTARTRLAKHMPDLARMLKHDSGCSCSSALLLKYLNLDQFSKHFTLEASNFELEVTEPVERSFFVFHLACELRKDLMTVQEQAGELQAYMDPRPYLEQGTDMFIWKHFSDVDALDQFVICQQISLKAGDLTCFGLVSDKLNVCMDLLASKSSQMDAYDQLLHCFRRRTADGEDPEAWTLFYAGKSGIDYAGQYLPELNYQMVKQALARSRTPILGYIACELLGCSWCPTSSDDVETKRGYLEQMVEFGRGIGKVELVINGLAKLFHLVMFRLRRFDKADNISRTMFEMWTSAASELDRALAMALTFYMKGSIYMFLLDEHQGRRFYESACEAFRAMPTYPVAASLHFYVASNEAPGWSSLRNSCAQTTYAKARSKPFPVDDLYGRIPLDENRASLYQGMEFTRRVDDLMSDGNLEEVEHEAAGFLQSLEFSSVGTRALARVQVMVLLARLASAYYQRNGSLQELKASLIALMSEFFERAVSCAAESAKLLPDYHLAGWINAMHALLLSELGDRAAALEKTEEMIRLSCLEMDQCFGSLSWARLKIRETLQPFFTTLQSGMWELQELRRALIWGERERARDLLYSLNNQGDREQYLKEFVEFDRDFDKAWSEIQQACEMAGKETVFIVISQRKLMDTVYTFFLHSDVELLGHSQMGFTSVDVLIKAIRYSSFSTWELLTEYYDMLVRPYVRELEQLQPKRIVFVPSEKMCLVPFSALFDSDSGTFLIQRYAVGTVPSLRFLKQCELRRKHVMLGDRLALVVSNPTLDLVHAEAEAESVGDILDKSSFRVTTLRREEATKQMVLDKLPVSSWIHIASHVEVDEEVYPSGALVLSGEADEIAALTSDEIQELLEAPVKAVGVVLSACSSGVGMVLAEGVIALPRSLHLKGVPSVVVSLWRVNDEATRMLMEKMYVNLSVGMELAEALQSAVLDILEDEFSVAANVKSWAAFAISGSPSVKF